MSQEMTMPLSEKKKEVLVDNINVALADIGRKAPTKPPRFTTNRESVAFEYWLTCHMLTMIKARQAAAKKAAIDAGVIFDSERDPRPPGTNEEIFRSDQVAVWLTVKNGGVSYDGKVMYQFLQETKKVPLKLLIDAFEASKKSARPAHAFMASLVSTASTEADQAA
jgi:hypothetical protein